MDLTPSETTGGDMTTDTNPHGLRLLLVWIGLASVVVIRLGLFFLSLPDYVVLLHQECVGIACPLSEALSPADTHALQALGLSMDFYATYMVTLQVTALVGSIAIGLFLFFHQPRDPMALFALLLIALISGNQGPAIALVQLQPAWQFPVACVTFVSSEVFLLFFFLFPDGHFVPRWTRFLAVGLVIYGVGRNFVPPSTLFDLVDTITYFGSVGLGVCAQIYRYVRVSTPIQRQQTKWLVFGCVAAVLVLLTNLIPLSAPHGSLVGLVLVAAQALSALLIPLSIAIAIVRYHLWAIDLIIKRTLVYGTLTACVVGLYVLVVGYLGALFRATGSLWISLIATSLVAVLFQPLRVWLQRGANRLLYGQRDEPYAVVVRLGRRLESTLAPEAVLSAIVETVAQALKLPYAAITLKQGEAFQTAAVYGSPVEGLLTLPLAYQAEPVGQLVLGPRQRSEAFTPADRQLLEDLARQVGVAAHAVRLTSDLQRSRERLVTAREEERRRLRRDLHDGLGPALGSLTLQLDTVRNLLTQDLSAADALLVDLKGQVQTALTDIRRLVYALRPPTLDELGLVSALREKVTHFRQPGLSITLNTPEHFPPLPAAVEVAVYRIAQEALTNVVRHAQAQECVLSLDVKNDVCLEICDDGQGLPANYRAGVGMTSIRDRAAELGGTCFIEPGSAGGTRVVVRLPLPKEEPHGSTSPRADR